PIRVLDDHHAPVAGGGGALCRHHQRAHLLLRDRELVRRDDGDIRVRVRERGAAGAALAAARALLALQRGGEGPRRGGASGAGRSRDQPGLGEGALRRGGAAELGDGGLLADDVGPHPAGRCRRGSGGGAGRGHCSSRWRGGGRGSNVGSNRLSTSPTAASTWSWTSSGGRVPSIT